MTLQTIPCPRDLAAQIGECQLRGCHNHADFRKDLGLQGAATTHWTSTSLKEEGIMPLAWPPKRVHLYTICRDHSWSVRVCIRVT
jgi:hypothetical protein